MPTRAARDRFVRGLSDPESAWWIFDFAEWAHAHQRPPAGDWTTWVLMGGRGAGKTRAGAEFIRAEVAAGRARRIALVGETYADVRETMVEGLSGLRAVHPPVGRPRWEASRRRLVWSNGAVAQGFSSEDPEALRGPQFDTAWADELGKWRHPDQTWDMLQFGLRLGEQPRQIVTTTPRPIPLLRRLLTAPGTEVTRAGTAANAAYLAASFLTAVVARYEGTRLGRQEIDGELIDDRPDALWTRDALDAARVVAAPALARVVVAVDPAVTGRRTSDACGLVVVGCSAEGIAYVLEDATLAATRPEIWAARAVAAFRAHEADCIVAEVNQGGDLVSAVLRHEDLTVPVRAVRATRGKYLRAEPVAALYAKGRVHHVGAFPALEDEMCDFGPDGLTGRRSPDRLDALVWALTALQLGARGPHVVRL